MKTKRLINFNEYLAYEKILEKHNTFSSIAQLVNIIERDDYDT